MKLNKKAMMMPGQAFGIGLVVGLAVAGGIVYYLISNGTLIFA